MSGRVVGWAFGRPEPLSPTQRFVLVAIADNSDDKGRSWPSREELGRKTGLSRASIYRALDALEAANLFVERFEAGRPHFYLAIDSQGEKPRSSASQGETTASQGETGSSQGEKSRNIEPSKNRQRTVSAIKIEDAPLSFLLADLIEANGAKRPAVTKRWADAERLMIERDGRDRDEAERLIRWAQADEFWRSNILSMSKFRDRFDQLALNAKRGRRTTKGAAAVDARIADLERVREQMRKRPPGR